MIDGKPQLLARVGKTNDIDLDAQNSFEVNKTQMKVLNELYLKLEDLPKKSHHQKQQEKNLPSY